MFFEYFTMTTETIADIVEIHTVLGNETIEDGFIYVGVNQLVGNRFTLNFASNVKAGNFVIVNAFEDVGELVLKKFGRKPYDKAQDYLLNIGIMNEEIENKRRLDKYELQVKIAENAGLDPLDLFQNI